jgi:CspA family cold shock protein
MAEETPKWSNDSNGFGFATRDVGGDVLVHHGAIQCPSFKSFCEGDRVDLDIVKGQKGAGRGKRAEEGLKEDTWQK